jgi:small ligand-binding sensory domain FIST
VAFVAALSAHPLAAHAAGEVVGRVLEQHADPVDVAVLVVSGAHVHQFEQIADVVRKTLAPRCLIGATAIGVVAGERSVLSQPAIALWVGTDPDAVVCHLDARVGTDGVEVSGLRATDVDGGRMLVVIASPAFPLDGAVVAVRERHPDTVVVGATVAAGVQRGDNKLVCDDRITTSGAVALVLDPASELIVSRGFRPIGIPLVVTGADGAVLRELAGRPILDRLDEVLVELDDAVASAVGRTLHLGQVVDEHQTSFGPGDFTVRQVVEVDRLGRSLSVAPPVEVGATVQFLGEDASGTDRDLREQLADHRAEGAITFLTDARLSLFREPDHDAELVSTIVRDQAVIGAVCQAVVVAPGRTLVDDGPTATTVLVQPRPSVP